MLSFLALVFSVNAFSWALLVCNKSSKTHVTSVTYSYAGGRCFTKPGGNDAKSLTLAPLGVPVPSPKVLQTSPKYKNIKFPIVGGVFCGVNLDGKEILKFYQAAGSNYGEPQNVILVITDAGVTWGHVISPGPSRAWCANTSNIPTTMRALPGSVKTQP